MKPTVRWANENEVPRKIRELRRRCDAGTLRCANCKNTAIAVMSVATEEEPDKCLVHPVCALCYDAIHRQGPVS